ncbi:hypothetical protein C8T65DRAFT_77420 [Cerioporus squamosus]|nr:hypothetical protein C8T65DRAFT_77420 [Cerioporus squamosus]
MRGLNATGQGLSAETVRRRNQLSETTEYAASYASRLFPDPDGRNNRIAPESTGLEARLASPRADAPRAAFSAGLSSSIRRSRTSAKGSLRRKAAWRPRVARSLPPLHATSSACCQHAVPATCSELAGQNKKPSIWAKTHEACRRKTRCARPLSSRDQGDSERRAQRNGSGKRPRRAGEQPGSSAWPRKMCPGALMNTRELERGLDSVPGSAGDASTSRQEA